MRSAREGNAMTEPLPSAAPPDFDRLNSAQRTARRRAHMMRQALRQFANLPEAKRKAGALKVEDPGVLDANYSRAVPEGGLILKAYTRILDFKDSGYCKGSCKALGGEKAARDHVWITKDEVKAMAPAKVEVGFRYAMPVKVATRLAQYHLIDNTRGEPEPWKPDDVRAKRMSLVVTSATADVIELRLEGEVLISTDADTSKAERGYEARLLGLLRYQVGKGTFDRFDLTAVGTHWGEHTHNSPARPGKGVLGQSFELAGDKPGDLVAPQGIRDREGYLGLK